LREIYAALAFYLDRTEYVEDYLKKQKTETQETVKFIEQNLPTENLRASIRARQRELQNRQKLRLLFDENFNQRIVRGLQLELPNLEFEIAQKCGLEGKSDPEVLD